jgi:hypothetical protein
VRSRSCELRSALTQIAFVFTVLQNAVYQSA